jgi:hypothetical protein
MKFTLGAVSLFLAVSFLSTADRFYERLLVGFPVYLMGLHWVKAFIFRTSMWAAHTISITSPLRRGLFFVLGVITVVGVLQYEFGFGFVMSP